MSVMSTDWFERKKEWSILSLQQPRTGRVVVVPSCRSFFFFSFQSDMTGTCVYNIYLYSMARIKGCLGTGYLSLRYASQVYEPDPRGICPLVRVTLRDVTCVPPRDAYQEVHSERTEHG